jgi:hypothetical protein
MAGSKDPEIKNAVAGILVLGATIAVVNLVGTPANGRVAILVGTLIASALIAGIAALVLWLRARSRRNIG